MRKIVSYLFVAALCLMIVGCSGENAVESTSTAMSSPVPTANESASTSPSETPVSTPEQPSSEGASTEPSSSSSPEPSKPAMETGNGEEAPTQTPSLSPASPPKATPSPEPEAATPAVDYITLSIVGNAEWGTILAAESVILDKGDSAASVLKRAAKAHRLSFEIRGSGAMTYVEGVDGLYEFDDGPTSGWKFRVNGVVSDIGAGTYKLKPGDRLEWFYVSEDDEAKEDKESAS
ncbi:DUF4430 domain-containing protein [Cohnella luojiensis]|uniref:DUF4430 domain-containing protein n=1 Tax=Cohnella luojiensis TaxID=652876 RepID=A0A4Y8LT10_9BACL|nr:DUF4430 domain-containing protein [Cohnella luojiensis]TFE24006.1 DUF4430 domain-containing protein [Cohnella luojiensis]